MLVGHCMSKNPVSATPDDLLSQAQRKMQEGGFRRVPIVSEGRLVGIITDHDIREHTGFLEKTRINAAMASKPITVSPGTTIEEATKLLLKHKIGGLPVVEHGHLVGMITASDIMKAFLDVMGALEEASTRIDFILEGKERGLAEASKIVAQEGGEVLGVGTYRAQWKDSTVCYLRVLSDNAERIIEVLKGNGFSVLGLHQTARSEGNLVSS